MNKCEALNWLVENVVKWPASGKDIQRCPSGWIWKRDFDAGCVTLVTELRPTVEITQQEWLDHMPHSSSESVFIDGLISEPIICEMATVSDDVAAASKKKIYISGPMTGYPEFNRPAFNTVADKIKSDGDIPLNPALSPDGLSEHEYMRLAMEQLLMADEIIFLEGWNQSKGARAEYAMAEKLGIEVRFLEGE